MDKQIPYAKQSISNDDIEAVVNVLKSDTLTQGELLKIFEQKVNNKVSSKYAIATNSATSALHLACLAIGVGEKDIVWTSPISFVASSNCALYCRAEIDFVDIDPSTALISISALEVKLEKAEKDGKLPKVLIPVHLAGTSCDMKEISRLSNKFGFRIIEDASHAIGGSYLNNPIGSCKYSDICIFSFHPVKIITTLEGGMAVTNNEEIFHKISLLRGHGITRDENEFIFNSPGPWYYEQQELGFNYRFNEVQASLGITQLKKLDKLVTKRNELMKNYRNFAKDIYNLEFLEETKGAYSAYHLAIIKLKDSTKDRHLSLFKYMRAHGVFVQIHYWPIHLQPYYCNLSFKKGDFPNAENYAISSFSLPIFPDLKDSEQLKVMKELKNGIDLIFNPN